MRKRDTFLEGLRARREAARTEAERTADKPISEISEPELDREIARLDAELRRNKEAAVEAGRRMRPTGQEREAYRAAEARIKESILLRDILPSHTYPGRGEDLATIKEYHSRYGIPELGLWARAKKLLRGEG